MLLWILTCFVNVLVAQLNHPSVSENHPGNKGNIYAVVIGISNYESSGIDQLEFAHKDAEVFAGFLKSVSGGAVPEENIRVLLNEKATFSAIYDALYWLRRSCSKDDLVYFYFSGHGDTEDETFYKLGFLLSYNTPRSNFINNAVRIEDLNNIANTLTIENKARVIIITDACHSGKLSGNENKGFKLVGEQLKTVQNKEVRIASCKPEEESAEDAGWGGGRGVFSYYLVKGLKGMADKQKDGIITVAEIRNFLDSAFRKDLLLAAKAHVQNPVVNGAADFRLSLADTGSVIETSDIATDAQQEEENVLPPLPKQPQAYFFDVFDNHKPEELLDFNELDKYSAETIAFACIRMLKNDSSFKVPVEKLDQLENRLKADTRTLKSFNHQLMVLLSDRGQDIINLYLDGNDAEMERRKYYSNAGRQYDSYVKMFSVALKLITPDNDFYKILQVKYYYFSGLAARLKVPSSQDPAPLIEEALKQQKRAYLLEENAAYIQNELGILYKLKKQYPEAEKYFINATRMSPSWAIPWSNLVGLYATMKDFKKGDSASEKAMALKPGLQNNYINTARLYEKEGDLLVAEELFQRSIEINTRHFLPYEKLGQIYLTTTKYELADRYFFEASFRKSGLAANNHGIDVDADGVLDATDMQLQPECPVNLNHIAKKDLVSLFVLGMDYFHSGQIKEAESSFKKILAVSKSHPLVYHYLGLLCFNNSRWQEGEVYFKLASENHLGEQAFTRYCDSASKEMSITAGSNCILSSFKKYYYPNLKNWQLLGTLYERWNHFGEAEQVYREMIRTRQGDKKGYRLLWMLLDKRERYIEEENLLSEYSKISKVYGDKQLYLFYKRMMVRFPENADWYYKAGIFLYNLAAVGPKKANQENAHEAINMADVMGRTDNDLFEDETAEVIEDFNATETGISWLKASDSIRDDQNPYRADINDKIGDLYIWNGQPDSAILFYSRSLKAKQDDAGIRNKMIDAATATYHYRIAMEQMDTLYARREINSKLQLQMAEYYIHSARFEKAFVLLNEIEKTAPFKIPGTIDLLGRLKMASGQTAQAIPLYKQYLEYFPADNKTMYTVAKLLVQTGNHTEALKWLEKSVKAGFNYSYVLINDISWKNIRNNAKWNAILNNMKPAVYEPLKNE